MLLTIRAFFSWVAVFLLGPAGLAAQRPAMGSDARQYVVVEAPVVALTKDGKAHRAASCEGGRQDAPTIVIRRHGQVTRLDWS